MMGCVENVQENYIDMLFLLLEVLWIYFHLLTIGLLILNHCL